MDTHLFGELGFSVTQRGDELVADAPLIDELAVPGTNSLRTSILAIWTDHLAGLLAVLAMSPRVPVTIELDVHLYAPVPATGTLHASARTFKAGRTVFVAGVE